MPRRNDPPADPPPGGVLDYRHDARRLNNPPAGLVSADHAARETRRARYAYDPHLSP